jgi:phytoene dehydrogenase-like protein
MGHKRKVVVVGAGMAGLTAGAYISREGHELLVLDKSAKCGGLVSSFTKDAFVFDTGPRAIGNAGILRPMLQDLGIDLPMVKGAVSTGIADRIVHYGSDAGIADFITSLRHFFPESGAEIAAIEKRIRFATKSAKVLNRVPNPFFKDVLGDWRFFFKEFLPLVPGFLLALATTSPPGHSIERALSSLSANGSLNDMVSQHFFKGTPASFAFGYFENYRDYLYPLGGTGRLPASLVGLIKAQGGSVQTDTEIVRVHPASRKLTDNAGNEYAYDFLLWAADLRSLYSRIDADGLSRKAALAIEREAKKYASTPSGESVFTLFLAVDEEPAEFRKISNGHFIYTPRSEGLGALRREGLDAIKADFGPASKARLFAWLRDFCRLNSYEIAIPCLKDSSLAPPGKTGLVVSLLFDGELFRMVREAGWYDEFKRELSERMLDALEASVYPGLRDKIIYRETASPLTLQGRFNTSDGAITGWSLEAKPPVPHSLAGVSSTYKTAVPGVYKAGQWYYSPSGVPVAILTGRIAAKAILRAAGSL